jgi:thiamine biosynthesis lipoprotein
MADGGLTRRRTITIMAAACAGLAGAVPAAAARHEWRGVALGANSRLIFDGLNKRAAQTMVARAVAEIDRLEQVFSLYRPGSQISRLNRDGALLHPSHDFMIVLAAAMQFWRRTDGAFNPAIQPLWRALADHFASRPADRDPPADLIADTLKYCDPSDIRISTRAVMLEAGMALTFNGIAQGYITDRVAGLLRGFGMRDVLIQLGETRALPGRTWKIAIKETGKRVNLADGAIATSAGRGTRFTPDGRWHHLIDPQTGQPGRRFDSVTVRAPTALMADALSTALAVSSPDRARSIARRFREARVIAAPAAG